MSLILSIDPSSTSTGWAVAERKGNDIVWKDIGRIKPSAKMSGAANAPARISGMISCMWIILNDYQPSLVIIEMPSGKTHASKKQNISYLPIYGWAAGAIWCTVGRYLNGMVDITRDNEWTRGAGNKARRATWARLICPQYVGMKDDGHDISDAICLMEWFCKKLAREEVIARGTVI